MRIYISNHMYFDALRTVVNFKIQISSKKFEFWPKNYQNGTIAANRPVSACFSRKHPSMIIFSNF